MATWTTSNKASTTFSTIAKNVVTWIQNSFLLKEDSYYLLLETGDKIIIDSPTNGRHTTAWTLGNKN